VSNNTVTMPGGCFGWMTQPDMLWVRARDRCERDESVYVYLFELGEQACIECKTQNRSSSNL